MDGETLDERVQDASRSGVEVPFKGAAAAFHPVGREKAVTVVVSGKRVELVGKNEITSAAEEIIVDVRDESVHCVIPRLRGEHALPDLIANGGREAGECFMDELIDPGEVVGHRAEGDVSGSGDFAVRNSRDPL